jgi:hypothetical protein
MDPMDKMEIYKTTDRGIAAYAMMLGHNCIGCVPSNHADVRRMDFVFIDVPNPKELEEQWYGSKKIMMSPFVYFQSLTQAIWLVKHPMTREEVEKLRG